MTTVESIRGGLFPPTLPSRSHSSPTIPEVATLSGYSFPGGPPKQEPPTTPPSIYRRQTYPPLETDDHDAPIDSPHRFTHQPEPLRSLSRPDPATYDTSRHQFYHTEAQSYGFPGSSGGPDPSRSASAANFEQLRHSIAAAHDEVSNEYSGLGRQVVMNGEARYDNDYNEYEEEISPQQQYYPPLYYPHPTQSVDRSGVQPQHLHPLQQQAPPAYIYGQPIGRPVYGPPDGHHHPPTDYAWPEEHQPPSPDPTRSVWRHGLNSGQTIPAHLLPPLPPLPPTATQPPQPPRPALYGHSYTPYSMGSVPGQGQVGGRDGWGPSTTHDSPYTSFGSHHPIEHSYGPAGPSIVDPVYVNPNAYSSRDPPSQLGPQFQLKPGTTTTTSSSTKKSSKARPPGGPPKARQKSVIFHPSPHAMLAPEVREMVAASALMARGSRENTPHIGTNAPALPDEETMKSMMTKRSRGRRPPAQAELIHDPDVDDPNLNPTEAQIAYCGLTKTGKPKKIFLCKVPACGKCFKRSEHLKRHVRSIHTNEKRESCRASSSLLTWEDADACLFSPAFQCKWPGCARYFSRHDNLNQHVSTAERHIS